MRRISERTEGISIFEINCAVEAVIDLMQKMASVIDEENSILSQGIPASLASTSARKVELADRFEEWVARVRNEQVQISHADVNVRMRLLAGTKALRAVMDENVVLLRIAMEASRRRVEAVMNAIREQISSNSPYSANGRLQSPLSPSSYSRTGRSI